jgi:Exocyst complex component Sec6
MKGSDGKYRTAFSEDVFSMTSIHLRTIRERLTRRSEALVQAVGVVFKILYDKQCRSRDSFCTDFPTCCAAANDFLRMSEKCEEIVDEIKLECNLSSKASEILEEQSAALLGVYSGDAVFAAKKTQTYCLSVIEDEVADELFSLEWEEELTQNETAHAIVSILDDCMSDVESGLDELMVSRAAEAQVTLIVNFYIDTLLKKGIASKGSKNGLFKDNDEAIQRMRDDVVVLQKYFRELADDHPTLGRIAEDEFSILESIFVLQEWGAAFKKTDGNDSISNQQTLKKCIGLLQKRIKNLAAVKFLVNDMLTMVNPSEEKNMNDIILSIEEWSNSLVNEKTQGTSAASDRYAIFELRLDQIIAKHMEDRKDGMKSITVSRAMGALRSLNMLKGKETKKEEKEAVPGKDEESEEELES